MNALAKKLDRIAAILDEDVDNTGADWFNKRATLNAITEVVTAPHSPPTPRALLGELVKHWRQTEPAETPFSGESFLQWLTEQQMNGVVRIWASFGESEALQAAELDALVEEANR